LEAPFSSFGISHLLSRGGDIRLFHIPPATQGRWGALALVWSRVTVKLLSTGHTSHQWPWTWPPPGHRCRVVHSSRTCLTAELQVLSGTWSWEYIHMSIYVYVHICIGFNRETKENMACK
jgi:hypothetical protein